MIDQLANLGIDWHSIVLYLANTAVLLDVLTKFLYKPILKFLDERKAQIEKSIQEAQTLQLEFEKKLKESEADKQAVEAELRSEIQNLKKFIDQKRAEMVAEMDAKRAEMMQKAQAEITERKATLLKEAEADVMALMTRIVLDIVQNKVPEKVIQDSIHSAWKDYNNN
jgi:F-type H+-transporting ATPase subunit b